MTPLKLLSTATIICLALSNLQTHAQSRPLRLTTNGPDLSVAKKHLEEAQKRLMNANARLKNATDALSNAQKSADDAKDKYGNAADAMKATAMAVPEITQNPTAAQAQAASVQAQATTLEAFAKTLTSASKDQASAIALKAAADSEVGAAEESVRDARQEVDTEQANICKLSWLVPASHCYKVEQADKSYKYDPNKAINNYYGLTNGYTFFDQVKSIYNGASETANISADLATLNVPWGLQFTFSTNVQAGVTTPATVAIGSQATLTPASAAQAAQNMLTGGTFAVTSILPLLHFVNSTPTTSASASTVTDPPGQVVFTTDLIAKGGADLQNFKAGTSTTVTNPPTHGNIGLESYLQINSTNVDKATGGIIGDIFVGGNYGYNYASHGYARDYGFGKRASSGVGQIAIGAVLSGIGRISVSRGFGPSQVYIDSTGSSTTPAPPVNNFKSWSFGLAYQSPAKATTNSDQNSGSH